MEEEEAFGLREQGKVCPEIQLTVLGNEGNGMEVTVPLWLSEEGIGYFFFPGFAEEKKLTDGRKIAFDRRKGDQPGRFDL